MTKKRFRQRWLDLSDWLRVACPRKKLFNMSPVNWNWPNIRVDHHNLEVSAQSGFKGKNRVRDELTLKV